jgi:hypothetical protein
MAAQRDKDWRCQKRHLAREGCNHPTTGRIVARHAERVIKAACKLAGPFLENRNYRVGVLLPDRVFEP